MNNLVKCDHIPTKLPNNNVYIKDNGDTITVFMHETVSLENLFNSKLLNVSKNDVNVKSYKMKLEFDDRTVNLVNVELTKKV